MNKFTDLGYFTTDSTMTIERQYYPDTKRLQGSIGYEWSREKKIKEVLWC